MDDMGTPGPNHPAWRGIKDKRSESQFNNVLDFTASRLIKERTGQVKAVRLSRTPESTDFEKHADEAMRMGNPRND